MSKRQGNQPPTEQNAYELARLFAGWSGKADHFINHGTFAPGKGLDVTGKGLKEILKPVDGKLDDLRIYLVARRAIEKGGQDIKTGISAKDARDALKQVETPALKKVAEDIYNYNDQLLQYLVKSEFMNPAQYDVIKKMNKNLCPVLSRDGIRRRRQGRRRQGFRGSMESGRADEGLDARDR